MLSRNEYGTIVKQTVYILCTHEGLAVAVGDSVLGILANSQRHATLQYPSRNYLGSLELDETET